MNIITLSTLAARKRQLNQLCAAAVEQQAKQNKAENTHLRQRRRYLAKQVLKRVSLGQHRSNRHWLHAVTLVFALWGFNALVTPNQAMAAPAFGNDNPLFGVIAGSDAMPAFADIDGDGDLDAFVGVYEGFVKYYRNDGTNLAPDFVADTAGNPLAAVSVGIDGYYGNAAPTFADIDADGDLDAFVGEYYGTIKYFRNTEIDGGSPEEGTGFVADAAGNPLALVPYAFGGSSSLTFANLDGDGDLDAFVGGNDGTVRYYRNDGTNLVPDFVADAAGNPLTGFDVGAESTPNFADIDADGDLDAFIGQRNGSVKYYRNTRIDAGADVGFVADSAANPLANFIPGRDSAPTFADLDGDGDLDAFVGTSIGTIIYYRNTEVDADVPGTGMVTDNLFAKHTVADWASPSFTDINGDGVLDAFVGDSTGTVKYFRNEGTNQAPTFVADVGGNPLDGFDVGQVAAPTFEDIDGDGDLDAFIGEQDGTVKYYRNTEIDAGADVGFIADGNPLAAVSVGNRSIPTFADLDGDGDLDAFVGELLGHINYFRNTEIDADVPGTGFVADNATDPLASLDIGVESAPTFADLDGDGDLDAFIGAGSSIKYFRNTEIDSMVQGTGFVADAANNPLAKIRIFMARPEFADIDGDGDLDVFVGGLAGSVKYYKNSDPVPATVDDTLDAVAGVAAITGDVVANDQFKSDGPAAVDFSIVAFDTTSTNGGTVVNNGDNTFTYTAPSDFQGSDSFTYTLDDGAGNTAVGKVAVTVSPTASDTGSGGDGGGGGALNPWSLLLLPLVNWLRRKNRKTLRPLFTEMTIAMRTLSALSARKRQKKIF